MALPASGQITMNQVNVELGNSGTAQISMNDAAVRGLFDDASGQIAMSQGYGRSSETVLTSAGNVNGQAQRKQITVSSFISSGDTLRIPSNIWVWSDDRDIAALIIDIPCTIQNDGKIIGKGGTASQSDGGGYGGPAIKINSSVSGVTINNNSGAYIAGGGAGGGDDNAGGGGAGGGRNVNGGSGGALNATGGNGVSPYGGGTVQGDGGGAGGGAGGYTQGYPGGGGGGGRILPGVGGTGGSHTWKGGDGGSAGNTGQAGQFTAYYGYYAGGGGGGWGAAGGRGGYVVYTGAGGSGISDSGNSYTLSNSGTIYGAT
tara:strand:- start:28801 stop:29748 length:948 start_codon:yes stop_codon:yes gene_type:complete